MADDTAHEDPYAYAATSDAADAGYTQYTYEGEVGYAGDYGDGDHYDYDYETYGLVYGDADAAANATADDDATAPAAVEWDPSATATDGYAGYAYDPASGEWVFTGETADGEGTAEGSYFALDDAAPTSPFGDHAYWQQYGDDASPAIEDEATLPTEGGDSGVVADATGADVVGPDATDAATSLSVPPAAVTPPSSSPSKSRKKKTKTKQERVQMRQAQLEKDEAANDADDGTLPDTSAATVMNTTGRVPTTRRAADTRAPTFLERERAKVRLHMRRLRAIRRKRLPLQVRILTVTRTHVSPLEIYFGGSIESALSDVFWAAMNGDLRRVRFLVEVEHVSVTDSGLDPWHMEQTPLHWAAKGGDAAVIEYLLNAGANPRSLDENGSLPLHLACWAGHVDATLALLRATDTKDLYVQDYDAALAPLDWAQLRGHVALVKAIEAYEDSKWLPKFVDDLVRGIIRYKIKLYKEPPKSPQSPTRGIQFRRPGGAAGNNQAPNEAAPLSADGAGKGEVATDPEAEKASQTPETASHPT